jgi:hypothetical protein
VLGDPLLLTISWTCIRVGAITLFLIHVVLSCFVATDQAARCRAHQAVMTRIVTRDAANNRALEATLGVSRPRYRHDRKCNTRKRDDRFHGLQSLCTVGFTTFKS